MTPNLEEHRLLALEHGVEAEDIFGVDDDFQKRIE